MITRGKRAAAALLETSLITVLCILAWWILEARLSFLKCNVFWHFGVKALLMLVALSAIILPRRSLKVYGFLPISPRFTLKWSSVSIAVFILPATASIMLSAALGAIKPVNLSPLGIILNIIFIMVFIGLVEEAYFRGYIQSRLNEVFEKRWRRLVFKAWGVKYGAGMFLVSIIFALVHVVNYWNPLISRWEPSWWMPLHILGCFAFGCLAGALREASDIYVPASLHGGVMTAYTFLSIYVSEMAMNISLFVSWFIFFYLLANFFRDAEQQNRAA